MVQINKSELKTIKQTLIKDIPLIEQLIEDLLPKKAIVYKMRLKENGKTDLIIVENEVICFKYYKAYIPTLRILHKYPQLMKHFQVDKGAIKFCLNGANIMCQGMTSPGGKIVDAEKDEIVLIYAEGKNNALGIGKLAMSSEEIKSVNQGMGLENLHCLGDDLWTLKDFHKK